MERFKAKISGFTLIELLVVIAIIGILAALAVPTYQGYTRRSYYSEVIQATASFKLGVETCYQGAGAQVLANCGANQNGVPAARAALIGNVASVSVANGIITATGGGNAPADTYILTPTASSGILTWAISGTCLTDANGAVC